MKTQTKMNSENIIQPQVQLTMLNTADLVVNPRPKILSRIFSAITNLFETNDLNYESWERLESHKYCRSHAQDSYQLGFYV